MRRQYERTVSSKVRIHTHHYLVKGVKYYGYLGGSGMHSRKVLLGLTATTALLLPPFALRDCKCTAHHRVACGQTRLGDIRRG
jgi:hypothetical protein